MKLHNKESSESEIQRFNSFIRFLQYQVSNDNTPQKNKPKDKDNIDESGH